MSATLCHAVLPPNLPSAYSIIHILSTLGLDLTRSQSFYPYLTDVFPDQNFAHKCLLTHKLCIFEEVFSVSTSYLSVIGLYEGCELCGITAPVKRKYLDI